MTIRELWEEYVRQNVIDGIETSEEIALQKCGFLCGAMAIADTIAQDIDIDFDEVTALLEEAFDEINLAIDKVRHKLNESIN